ncbi:MAG: universal stress protein [Betaproteobacteria bacterium]|nr:universal stress protein [Betaproteobacteria bacterium]MDE2622765.1 universal stress protein [Betaproteobacteria bacterium]
MASLFERILLATEHTDFDAVAESLALDLASRCSVPLRAVLPMIRNLEYEIASPDLAGRQAEDFSRKAADLRKQAARAGVILETAVKPCEALHRGILEEARSFGASLLVARRRGRQGFLSNLLVGEMVSKVAAEAPCTMLFAPANARPWNRGALVALDPAAPGEGIIRAALEVAASCKLALNFMAVTEQPSQAGMLLERACQEAQARGITASSHRAAGSPAEQILAHAAALPADVILVGRERGGRFLKSAFGSTSRKIIGLADCAVLLVKATE